MSVHSFIAVFLLSCLLPGCASVTKPPGNGGDLPSSAKVADTTIVAIAMPAAKCGCSLPEFLGLPGIAQGIGGFLQRAPLRSRLGKVFPGLEPKPPLLTITDPANLAPDAPPAVKAAAKVKAEEDAAEQKIKAIRYLGKLGCGGCYPDVEDALLAALDDCTESVRFEAVSAIRNSTGSPCRYCHCQSCCSKKIAEKLAKMAYDTHPNGCFVEPSARVRRLARLALCQCGSVAAEEEDVASEVPTEGPAGDADEPVGEAPEEPLPAPSPSPPAAAAHVKPTEAEPLAESREQASEVVPAVWSTDGKPQESKTITKTSHLASRPPHDTANETVNEVRWERISLGKRAGATPPQATLWMRYVRELALGHEVEAPNGFPNEELNWATYRWTRTDQIESAILREAVKAAALGEVSLTLEDEQGWHLVRVLERRACRALE